MADGHSRSRPINSNMATELETLLKLSVPVLVQVGQRHMEMDDVLALAPGALLELNKPSEAELELLVNNKIIGTGTVVKVGENFGFRISSISSPSKVIEAMGE